MTPELVVVAVPNASIVDPTEICCGLLALTAPCPRIVTAVLAPIAMMLVPGMKVLLPSLAIKVPSSMASVLPLRADTTPDTRSSPDPCTLLPANTCDAVNDTVEVVLATSVVPVSGVVVLVVVVPVSVVAGVVVATAVLVVVVLELSVP